MKNSCEICCRILCELLLKCLRRTLGTKYHQSKCVYTKQRMTSPSRFLTLVVEFQDLQAARSLITCTAQHLRFPLAQLSNLPPRPLLSPGHHPWRWWILWSRTLRGNSAHARLGLWAPSLSTLRQIFQVGVVIKIFFGAKSLKLYSRGDIKIASVDGYGTDVYVYLQRLSHLAQENLPVYNAVSSAKLRNSATQVNDWTDLGNMQWSTYWYNDSVPIVAT